VSCALSNSCTSPFRTVFLFDSTTPSSLRLLLNVCACTDPHVPPTKTISLNFHPPCSPTEFPATFSRLLTRTAEIPHEMRARGANPQCAADGQGLRGAPLALAPCPAAAPVSSVTSSSSTTTVLTGRRLPDVRHCVYNF
jgi:hypothetical protein